MPGNHDVSDHHFRRSLVPINTDIESSAKKQLVQELFSQHSRFRWSWSELALYKIEDASMYSQRFAAFTDFYNRFYECQRSYVTDPANQFDIFDFPDWKFSITGFCSCYNNDLLNRQGMVHPDCVAEAGRRLRASRYQGWLRMAVWHHNIAGSPLQVDYLDPDLVQNLVDGGFSLGFHGHQHKPQFLDTRFQYGSNRRITTISAGTLCGSAAPRFGRAYNLIELDVENGSGHLFVREMQNDNLQLPIWGARAMSSNSGGGIAFGFDPPPEPFSNPNHNTILLVQAQDLIHDGAYREAAHILSRITESEKLARRLLLECLIELEDAQEIIATFDPPEGVAEVIALMNSLWDQNMRNRLAEVLDLPLVAKSNDPSVIEMRQKYLMRLK